MQSGVIMAAVACIFWLTLLLVFRCGAAADSYTLSDATVGRVFDGIGGLSGGGATSRLLVDYPQKQRDEILDLLFKPNFGASLQILKVEIGGDAQSTDGTEPSHMHNEKDENYQRGYEWWLMTEAKKRNPNIKLYALSWAFPAWVGKGKGSPYSYPNTTADYIVKWINGSRTYHNLTIDYVGIWNERSYDAKYIKVLRGELDRNNLKNVKIVAADGAFKDIAINVNNDTELSKAVAILGAHYPGTVSTVDAMKSNKPLWASEDYSTFNDNVGSGCWARILNQNYVNGNMTATISWNLVASYYDGLPFFRDGLMTAIEPWSGCYEDSGPIWITAHTTQFAKPGVHYLAKGSGVGRLNGGGSYVTFFDSQSKDFTIVIETMSYNNSICIRPNIKNFDVSEKQSVEFHLMGNLKKKGSFGRHATLYQWVSNVAGDSKNYFQQKGTVSIKNNVVAVDIPVDTVMTLTTIKGGQRGSFSDVPGSKIFPIPLSDTFDSYANHTEAKYFADQTGVFEIIPDSTDKTKKNKVMRQMITDRPITWCTDADSTITVIGNFSWKSMETEVMVKLESGNTAAFIAGGVTQGGCAIAGAKGIYGSVSTAGHWAITTDLAMHNVLKAGIISISINTWHRLSLAIDAANKIVTLMFDNIKVTTPLPVSYSGGAVGFGTGGFYPAQFDNFTISSAST